MASACHRYNRVGRDSKRGQRNKLGAHSQDDGLAVVRSEEVGRQETEPLSLTPGGKSWHPSTLNHLSLPSNSFLSPTALPTSPPSFLKGRCRGHTQSKYKGGKKSCLFHWQLSLGFGGGHPRHGVAEVEWGAVMLSRQRNTE